jgi:hypothetical protein
MQLTECSGQTDSRKIQSQAMGSCSHPQEGSNRRFVCIGAEGKTGTETTARPVEELEKVNQELQNTKDALAAVGHELSLLKKRVD